MRTTEAEITIATLQILFATSSGELSTEEIKRQIPNHVTLTPDDHVRSETRENEELWEQIVRNIVSHQNSEGNAIANGFLEHPRRGILRITDAGRLHIENLNN